MVNKRRITNRSLYNGCVRKVGQRGTERKPTVHKLLPLGLPLTSSFF